jgi:hypothetical protein
VEVEFVNVYIAKQKSWIEDLVAKQIILEARLQLAEAKAAQLADDLSKLNTKIEKTTKKKSESSDNSF